VPDAQLRSSRQNILDGRVVSSDVVCAIIIGVFVGFSRIFLLGMLIFIGFTARRLYKSFGFKGLKQDYGKNV
jgi:hypothetical protein